MLVPATGIMRTVGQGSTRNRTADLASSPSNDMISRSNSRERRDLIINSIMGRSHRGRMDHSMDDDMPGSSVDRRGPHLNDDMPSSSYGSRGSSLNEEMPGSSASGRRRALKNMQSSRGQRASPFAGTTTFNYKLKMKKSNRAIRFTTSFSSIEHLKKVVIREIEIAYGIKASDIELCYVDMDGDEVSLTTDKSLADAVTILLEQPVFTMELRIVSFGQRSVLQPHEKDTLSPLLASGQDNPRQHIYPDTDTLTTSSKPLVIMGMNLSTLVKHTNLISLIVTPLLCASLLFYFKFSRRSLYVLKCHIFSLGIRRILSRLLYCSHIHICSSFYHRTRGIPRTPERLLW